MTVVTYVLYGLIGGGALLALVRLAVPTRLREAE